MDDTVHRINLKGPWDFFPLNRASVASPNFVTQEPLPPAGTVKFPADWQAILGEFRGTVRFTRRFNLPTNLIATDRVDLVLDGVGGTARIVLNQHPVGTIGEPDQTARFDVTSSLRPHNQLEITVDWNGIVPELGGLWGPVALEITSANDDWQTPPAIQSANG